MKVEKANQKKHANITGNEGRKKQERKSNKAISLSKDNGHNAVQAHKATETPPPVQGFALVSGLSRDMNVHPNMKKRRGKPFC